MKEKVLFLSLFFISGIITAQFNENDYVKFIKNGVVLSTYLDLNEPQKIIDYLNKNDFSYYDTDNQNEIEYVSLNNAISGLFTINNNEDLKWIDFIIKEEINHEKFLSDFFQTMELGLIRNMFDQMIEQFKDNPNFSIVSENMVSYKNNIGEVRYYSLSNFCKSPYDKKGNTCLFIPPSGSIMIRYIKDIKTIRFLGTQIKDDNWIDSFINNNLNEIIYQKI